MTWHWAPREDQDSGYEAVTCDECHHRIQVRDNPDLIPEMDDHQSHHNPEWRTQ